MEACDRDFERDRVNRSWHISTRRVPACGGSAIWWRARAAQGVYGEVAHGT